MSAWGGRRLNRHNVIIECYGVDVVVVPPAFKDYEDMTRKQVQELGKDDIVSFRSILEGMKHVLCLWEVGRAFQS